MKAIILEAFGGPEVLKLREIPPPVLKRGEVLVKVHAAGVCHHDVMHRAGKLPGAKVGVVLGHETAGEVVAHGEGGSPHAIGTRAVIYQRAFCGECRDCLRGRQDMCRAASLPSVDAEGGTAEYVAVPSSAIIPIPDGLDFVSAALASCPIATSLRALTSVAGMQPGDTVLITGASGGLGAHQIQIVKALGGRAIAVTTSERKVAFLKSLGAHDVVVASNGEFGAAVWKLTGKRGVDIAVENVGPSLPETIRCVTYGGTAVVLGNIGAQPVPIPPGLLIGRRITVAGSGMGTMEDLRKSIAMLANGQVKPVISKVLPFSEIASAHEMLDTRAVEGRVVMQGW
ncbi:alcohol dehydrogenase [Burkholderia stagnalis]|uniref:alcohol dehydrogenase catalytic domain-containing protein n=1 Tax=Burkholderia stagnalis TaxID=1503054 RepID=UPI000759FF4B|nr:alcohol dehydrogenase catalytic domain-containing protein [Burkholderia stagnalis]KVL88910.1 alcohol dehydrogenase [Burkholderia stagnalis]KVL97099.1 alcohol dehydrogenase [Burkholderia stagnalis]KVM17687.1 alcohol dehydrogenase [Burkholderia stagnalis]KVN14826.1 alcohol dehydrogenase [Burkholderia stagnalis]KVN38898.1 alcohol dehydrogenase [Burkholderia stagnalis]